MASLWRLSALVLFVLFVAGACSSDGTSKVQLAGTCSINSDCASPLVCAFSSCHNACRVTGDCPPSERCVASDRPFDVCQLPSEKLCTHNSECPLGQLCGVDGQCRDQCQVDRDCVVGQLCVSGTCADPSDLDGGKLPVKIDGGASVSPTGQPCDYTSECASPLVCRTGLCVYECLADVDCSGGASCVAHACVGAGTVVGPGTDGGIPAGAPPGYGKACAYNSQCTPPLACRGDRCGYECFADVDCASGDRCVNHNCRTPGTSSPGTDAGCIPATCLSSSKNCGVIADGCGGTVSCGTCPSGEGCGAGGIANVCAAGTCSAKSCEAQGKNCGLISDDCSLPLDCGTCTAPESCGGGGVANVCGCKPIAGACTGKDCGTVVDSCGTAQSCGACTAPNTCGGAGTPNLCGCAKATCPAGTCGYIADGCGGVLNCGNCTIGVCGGAPAAGGAGTPNACGPGACAATTCKTLGENCGVISDGCSGTLSCGSCTAPETCGGGGTANVCGCSKTTCAAQGKNCDTIPDGCGGVLDCGPCQDPQTCGGGGTPNVCGCVPTTCAAQNMNCGTISDACGGLLNCGGCDSPLVCGGSGVPNVCATAERPPSCVGGGEGAGNTCGTSNDDCCGSNLVPAGSFNRDGDPTYPATVTAFRLDRYLVSVGRFRAFVNAGKGTQASPPADWSGGHPKIPNSGWNPAWDQNLAASTSALTTGLTCESYSTWTNAAANSDNNPIVCETWYDAMAFCAWDNGWLSTEVEFNAAQEGENEQRYFPWSVPPGSTTVDITYADFTGIAGSTGHVTPVGAKSPKGDGKYGQTDLVGNVYQWMMDVWNSPYALTTCADCAYFGSNTTDHVIRSGSWDTGPESNSFRTNFGVGTRHDQVGFRCAHLP